MSRIPRIDDVGSIIRDLRIRLERLERGKAIVGGSGNSQGLQDPTILTGDMIVRDQGGIDRLAIGAVGTFLQVKNLGNFANVLLNLNPYLWYRLNEASGTTMADSSQSGAHSGLYSAAGVTYHVAPPTGDGDFAVTFNGSTGYAHVGANPTGGGDFSVAFFYKSGAVGASLPAIGTSGGVFGNPPSWEFVPGGEAGDGRPEFAFTTGTSFGSPIGGSLRFNSGPSITDGNWHQIVMTRVMSTGVVTIYVDGSPISVSVVNASDSVISNAIMAGSALNGGSDMFMGAATATTAFCPCSLDEVATWQRVLSAAEVAHLYAQTPGAAAPIPTWGALPTFMTNPMTTQDDIIIGGAAGAPARLGKGTTGYVLTVDPTTGHIVWAASAAGFSDPTTTKGDLIVHGTSTTRLPVGSDGQVLTARSTATNGVDWEAAGGGTAVYAFPFDVPPGTPSTYDDEFNGTSIDVKWRTNSACVSTNTIANGAVVMDVGAAPSTRGGYILVQTFTGTDFTASAKIGHNAKTGDQRIGIFAASTSDGHINLIGDQRTNTRIANADGATGYSEAAAWGAYDGFDVFEAPEWPGTIWFRLQYTASTSTMLYSYSADGMTWRQLTSRTTVTQPNRFGLVIWANTGNPAASTRLACDWFRVTTP